MPDLSLDLRYLRLAFLVAESGSFRAVGESENLSQSTVSRRIQILERRLGILLFERSAHGAELTVQGRRFIETATVGATHLRQAIADTRKIEAAEAGILRIGVMTSLAGGFLPDLMQRYASANPRVRIRIDEISSQLTEGALRSSLDMAFVVGEPLISGCEGTAFWSEGIVVAVAASHRLALAGKVEWIDLKDEIFLVPATEQGVDLEALLMKKLPDCLRPQISAHGVGRDSLLGLVARDFGVFVSLESGTGNVSNDIVFLPIGAETEKLPIIGLRNRRNGNPAIKSFMEFAVKYARLRGQGARYS